MAEISYTVLLDYFRDIQVKHVDLNSFFRFDRREIMGKMRSGVNYPALLMEDTDIDYAENGGQNKYEGFEVSVLVLKYAKSGDFGLIEQVLGECQEIAREIERRITGDSENPAHWLYNRYDANSTTIHKVGPIFSDPCYGYRLTTTLFNTMGKRLPNTAKWSDL